MFVRCRELRAVPDHVWFAVVVLACEIVWGGLALLLGWRTLLIARQPPLMEDHVAKQWAHVEGSAGRARQRQATTRREGVTVAEGKEPADVEARDAMEAGGHIGYGIGHAALKVPAAAANDGEAENVDGEGEEKHVSIWTPVFRVLVYCGQESVAVIRECVEAILSQETDEARVYVYLVDDER